MAGYAFHLRSLSHGGRGRLILLRHKSIATIETIEFFGNEYFKKMRVISMT
jgi:hypothetical protein